MKKIELFCPAKTNLFLAVTGRRADGFHDLLSLMVGLDFGDRLRLIFREEEGIELLCNASDLPRDSKNLAVRAAEVFRERFPFSGGLRIELEKNIPAGAGLGGGSSNAAGVLLGLNRLLDHPAAEGELLEMAAEIGSDCAFFLDPAPSILRGRGEIVEAVSESVAKRLSGRRFLLVKPSFSISTAWAYQALARNPGNYVDKKEAEERLERWFSAEEAAPGELFFNSFESPVFWKFIPLRVLKEQLEEEFDLPVLLSGSGSALILSVGEDPAEAVVARIRAAFGEEAWIVESRILQRRDRFSGSREGGETAI